MDTKSIESQDLAIIENALVAFREIWRKKLLVFLVTIAGLLASIVMIMVLGNSTRYESSATLFSAVYGSYDNTREGVEVMNRYSDLIRSTRVCNRAVQALNGYNLTADDLQEMVDDGYIEISGASSSSATYGYMLTITVYAESEDLAIPLTNAIVSSFAAELNELIGSDMIQVLDEATECEEYHETSFLLYAAILTGGAFILVCGIIFVMTFFSPRVHSAEQCEQDPDLILGMLPYVKERKQEDHV